MLVRVVCFSAHGITGSRNVHGLLINEIKLLEIENVKAEDPIFGLTQRRFVVTQYMYPNFHAVSSVYIYSIYYVLYTTCGTSLLLELYILSVIMIHFFKEPYCKCHRNSKRFGPGLGLEKSGLIGVQPA